MDVKIKLDGGIMPIKATSGAAAYDLYVPEDVLLKKGRQVIDLKFSIEIPHGYAATIQPRSGYSSKGVDAYKLARKKWFPLVVSKTCRIDADVLLGLIDEDYRGHVGVIINNNERVFFHDVVIPRGTRIAQMKFVKVPLTTLVKTEILNNTERGEGGFGHTNK